MGARSPVSSCCNPLKRKLDLRPTKYNLSKFTPLRFLLVSQPQQRRVSRQSHLEGRYEGLRPLLLSSTTRRVGAYHFCSDQMRLSLAPNTLLHLAIEYVWRCHSLNCARVRKRKGRIVGRVTVESRLGMGSTFRAALNVNKNRFDLPTTRLGSKRYASK